MSGTFTIAHREQRVTVRDSAGVDAKGVQVSGESPADWSIRVTAPTWSACWTMKVAGQRPTLHIPADGLRGLDAAARVHAGEVIHTFGKLTPSPNEWLLAIERAMSEEGGKKAEEAAAPPRYPHADCPYEACNFLGRYGSRDLYHHLDGKDDLLFVCYEELGVGKLHTWSTHACMVNKPEYEGLFAEAVRRANARGLLMTRPAVEGRPPAQAVPVEKGPADVRKVDDYETARQLVQELCDLFNSRYPVGSVCRYERYPGLPPLLVTTQTPAYPCAWPHLSPTVSVRAGDDTETVRAELKNLQLPPPRDDGEEWRDLRTDPPVDIDPTTYVYVAKSNDPVVTVTDVSNVYSRGGKGWWRQLGCSKADAPTENAEEEAIEMRGESTEYPHTCQYKQCTFLGRDGLVDLYYHRDPVLGEQLARYWRGIGRDQRLHVITTSPAYRADGFNEAYTRAAKRGLLLDASALMAGTPTEQPTPVEVPAPPIKKTAFDVVVVRSLSLTRLAESLTNAADAAAYSAAALNLMGVAKLIYDMPNAPFTQEEHHAP